MLKLIVGPSGSGKTTYMMAELRRLWQAGGQVLLLVPEQFSFQMERRVLLELGGKAQGQVLVKSFSHLCRWVYQQYGGGAGQPISEAARLILLSLTLDDLGSSLKEYGRAAKKPGFAPALLQLFDQCKNAGVSPQDLADFSQEEPGERLREKTLELSQLYETYQAYVSRSFVDERDDLARCIQLLQGKNAFKDWTVLVDSFRDLTPMEQKMLDVMLESCKGMELSILSNNLEITGKNENQNENNSFNIVKENALHIISLAKQRQRPVAAPIKLKEAPRYKKPQLAWLAENLTKLSPKAYEGPQGGVHVYRGADPYDELRFAAAQISHLVKTEGLRYRDFTIIVRDMEQYETSVDALFRQHEIPLFRDRRREIRSVALIRGVQEALEAVRCNFATEHMLALAKSPLLGLDSTTVLELENYCRVWRIQRQQWLSPFEGNPDGLSARPDPEQAQRLERLNACAAALREPLLHLKEALQEADGLAFAQGIYGYLEEIGAREKLRQAFGREDLLYEKLLQENSEAWDLLMDLLDTLAQLLKGRVLPLEQLCELFRLGVEASDFGTIPNTLDQVTIGSADRIRPNEPKIVFVLGMNEGEFPPQLTEQPFFTGSERQALLEKGLALGPTIPRQSDYEELYAYSALTAASQGLYLCYHQLNQKGEAAQPSLRLRQILSLSGVREQSRQSLGEGFFAVNGPSAFMAYCRESAQHSAAGTALRQVLEEEGWSPRLRQVEQALEQRPFALEDKNLAWELFGPVLHLTSTNVDQYFSCPFAYFCYSGLHLREPRRADYSALEAGNLLHHLLAQMVSRHGGKGLGELSFEQLEQESAQLVEDYLRDCAGDPEKLRQRSQYLFRSLSRRAAYLLRQLGEEFQQSQFEPLYCELPIRPGSLVPPVQFGSPSGLRISIEGIVDRVDVMEAQGRRYARVVDYKSGGQTFSFGEMVRGLKLQMLLYLLSICQNGQGPLEGAVPAGVLYFPAKEASVSVPPGTSSQEVAQLRRKQYRMTGLVLEDDVCIQGMERPQLVPGKGKNAEPRPMIKGTYIPVESTAKGYHARSKLVTEGEMGEIFRHIRRLMGQMAEELSQGEIPASPQGTKSRPPCTYCAYRSICRRQEEAPAQELESLKREDAFALLSQLDQQEDEEGGESHASVDARTEDRH